MPRLLRAEIFARGQPTQGTAVMTKAIARVQALPTVPEPGDASEAFLRIAAPTRLL